MNVAVAVSTKAREVKMYDYNYNMYNIINVIYKDIYF